MNSSAERFEHIYKNNKWFGRESVSGRGSDSDQTRAVVKELPLLLREFGVKSMLDIPCGDWNWMCEVDLGGIEYIGADIVERLVEIDNAIYTDNKISFVKLDITEDDLPQVDLVLVRDCFVHLSYEDIFKALDNIRKSGSRYLLTTTFTNKKNKDIETGEWRALNLQAAPFNFPEPIKLINEQCTLKHGAYKDKSLGLWKL